MATNKKKKVDTESRIFQEKWTIDYFFTQINEKPVCLLCSESVSVMKEYNVRRHYVTKHSAKYYSFQGFSTQERKGSKYDKEFETTTINFHKEK